jgi:predicted secreted protein
MAVIKGNELMLFLTSNGVTKSIAYATSHTMNISADAKAISSKDSEGGFTDSEVGLLSWTVNSENLMANSGNGYVFDDLFDLMLAKEKIDVVFTRRSGGVNGSITENGWTVGTETQYKGQVIITSLEQSASNEDNATMKVDMTGCGKLEKVTVTSASTKSTTSTTTSSK